MYTFFEFNQLAPDKASEKLQTCCGASKWLEQMLQSFPFADEKDLFDTARKTWYENCGQEDYLEAFKHHPKIGDRESLAKKIASTKDWAGEEQAAVADAHANTIAELADLNEVYFQKFGYIFIVFATGKSAKEMLSLLKQRLEHDPEEELAVAMGEQFKITLLRLQKLIKLEAPFWNAVSQITTHVLDTAVGTPGKGMCIKLKQQLDGQWQTMALGITNEDGRIANLLPAGVELDPGEYQMSFDTAGYFQQSATKSFYPQVDIHFQTFDTSHYHVPLLINPYGYTTYRGS